MKVLHLSFHYGCIRSINALFNELGHTVDYVYARKEFDYKITRQMAFSIWEQYKDKWNTYDLIMTSDTVALSYIFLLNISEVKPKLLIWICNRYDYAMQENEEFQELLRKVGRGVEYGSKIKLVPYTEYERIYCGKHNIWVREPVLLPYGNVMGTEKFNGQSGDKEMPVIVDNSRITKEKHETIYISMYCNDNYFFPFKDTLSQQGFSVASGEFAGIEDLQGYKCIVTLPDAFSKFFFFELLNIQLPIFIPTEEFFLHLNKCVRQSETNEFHKYCFTIEGNIVPPQYVDLCEWYKYPNSVVFFNSFEDLIEKLREFSVDKREKMKIQMKKDAEFHNSMVKQTATKILKDIFDGV